MALAAMAILVLAGFGFLGDAFITQSRTLKTWLLPLGPWCCALVAYSAMRRSSRSEEASD